MPTSSTGAGIKIPGLGRAMPVSGPILREDARLLAKQPGGPPDVELVHGVGATPSPP